MYSDDELESAVEAGVLTAQAAAAFRAHVAQKRATPIVDEEYFRLISGFNDIFVVIACLLLLVSITWIGASVSLVFGAILQTITAWGLAEYFTRQRRMALPSIVLLLAFVGGVLAIGGLILEGFNLSYDLTIGISSAAAAIAAWLHWLRFKVPITVAAGTAALVAGVMMIMFALIPIPGMRQWAMMPLTFIAGISVFMLAMKWDASDTLRQTRRSDVAFWLHLIAAPLIVHPVFSALDIFDGQVGLWQASAVTMLYMAIAIVSISIDRRAMMVSALIYVLYAFDTLLEQFGIISLGFAFTAFSVGSGLLLVSVFWHSCRKALVQFYPGFIQQQLPSLR